MLHHHDGIETQDPRTLLEESESEHEVTHPDLSEAMSRLLVWLLAGGTYSTVGFRVHVLAHKLRPDFINGRTLDSISSVLGHGRSSAQKLSDELSEQFQIRGMHDRSPEARKRYSAAWHRRNRSS